MIAMKRGIAILVMLVSLEIMEPAPRITLSMRRNRNV
jgi:hypothetical protein